MELRFAVACVACIACGDSGGTSADAAMGDGATSDGATTDGAPIIDADPSCMFSDDFAGASLSSCWTVMNGGANPIIQITQTGGALHLQAISGADRRWYNGGTGSLVYQTVTAWNFKITTTVHPRKRTDSDAAPTIDLHVGGLLVRDPSSQGGTTENYVMLMAGSNELSQPGIEVKSTTDGHSVWAEPTWASPLVAELRMCRLHDEIYLYKRVPAGTWMLANELDQAAPVTRGDLPETLQVGMSLNFGGAPTDLDVAFDAIAMSTTPPASIADCTAD
jgi:hypothetical protein